MPRRKEPPEPDFVVVDGVRWPVLGPEQMASACGFTSDFLRQLERAKRFRKLGHGRYNPLDVFRGVIAYQRDEERRSTKSAESRRVLEARAREIELRTAEREGRLVQAEDVAEYHALGLQAFRSELAGVPAAATRDLALRLQIERPLERAIARLRDSFTREPWGEFSVRLANERMGEMETSLKNAPPPGDSVLETAAAAVRAARTSKPKTKPPARNTRKRVAR